MRETSNEVFYIDEEIVQVGHSAIDVLKDRVGATTRGRVRICAHRDVNDPLHEMFILLTKESYIRPHLHLGKAESLYVVEGMVDVVFFDKAGQLTNVMQLGDYLTGRQFYYRLNVAEYHTIEVVSDFVVIHEVTQGPFRTTDNVPADWAPDEGDYQGILGFRDRLRESVAGFIKKQVPK